MKLTVKDAQGRDQGELEVKLPLIDNHKGTQAVHDVVTAYRANQRMGTACTKTMGEVAGSGKKPWRQKGTGRARAGSIRSSLWRHGSIAHGPKPRDYSYEIPQKMLRGALRSALAAKFQENKLKVIDQFNLADAKTKVFAASLAKLQAGKTVLVVNEGPNRNLELSARNIPGCELARHHKVHPYQVLSHDQLLISESALMRLQESLR